MVVCSKERTAVASIIVPLSILSLCMHVCVCQRICAETYTCLKYSGIHVLQYVNKDIPQRSNKIEVFAKEVDIEHVHIYDWMYDIRLVHILHGDQNNKYRICSMALALVHIRAISTQLHSKPES